MREEAGHGRRYFLGRTAMTLAAAQLGVMCAAKATEGESRELAALGRATGWLNSPALSAANLAGKVVLVQFGTYTCINWLRTLPFVRAWHQNYRPGLVVIGVHTPEFAFEKNLENVRRAVRQMKLEFPVVMDNDYAIWRAFDNHYWPALYFIDARGRLRRHHFGEGEYERSEETIRELLAETGVASTARNVVPITASGFEVPADWRHLKSPEIYLGRRRTESFSSPGGAGPKQRRLYAAPTRLVRNAWGLAGEWTMTDEQVVSSSAPGRIVCRFHARDVHLVMGSPQDRPIRFRIALDGQPPGSAHGLDADDGGSGTAAEQRLYQLVRQPEPIVERTFEIEFLDAGVEAFAFTFG